MSSEVGNKTTPEPVVENPAASQLISEESFGQAFRERLRRGDLGMLPAIAMLVVIVAVFEYISKGVFLYPINLSNLLLQESYVAVIALAAVLVLLLAEIDLSLAAAAYFCGGVATILTTYHQWSALPAVLVTLATGCVIGLANGFFVAVLRIPSFIVTLATFLICSGLLLLIEYPNTSIRMNDPFILGILTGFVIFPWDLLSPIPFILIYAGALFYQRAQRMKFGLRADPLWSIWLRVGIVAVLSIIAVTVLEQALGVPYSLYIVLGVTLLLWLLLKFTTYGRHVYAVGGNPEASRRAGISVTGVRVSIFALASTLAAFAGILLTSETGTAPTGIDPSLLLLSIAVAVIGGISLFGGRGSVWGMLMGILIIGSLSNGLALFPSNNGSYQFILEGAVLLAAVVLDAVVRRRNAVSGR
jgi:D-xylose transport system permease protein